MGPLPGPPPPWGPVKVLCTIIMLHIRAEIAGAGVGHDRIHIGAVEIDERAEFMQPVGNRLNIFFEQSQCIGIGNHEDGRIGAELEFQIVEIDEAVRAAL